MSEVKSDIQIAREAKMLPIKDILAKINVPDESSAFSPMGRHIAKINLEYLDSLKSKKEGKLILVTAITPTPAGEGKTTTSVGLNDGLNKIGKKSIVCLREPSLGPSFGMKGGAAAPPFIPKDGPKLGSRKQTIDFFPILFKPSLRPTEVVVLPSPAGVGVIAVTKINFPSFLLFKLSKYSKFIFAI